MISRESRISIMPFIVGVSLIALFIFAYYIFTWRSFFNFQIAVSTCGNLFCDFADYYYPMGESILRTGLPIEGFVYSPFIAILLVVFPMLGFKVSLVLWGMLQAISIILYLLLFRQLVPARLPIQLLFAALLLSSFPFLHTLTWGQVSIFTTVAILGALVFYERGQLVIAAVLLALGLSFKFFPIIFLVPFILRRDIRFLVFAAAACVTFLFVVPCVILGVGNTLDFYSVLLNSYRHFDWVIANHGSQYFPHIALRLMKEMGFNAYVYLPLLRWTSYGIFAINMGMIYLVQRVRLPHANLWSFHTLFLSIPFVLMTSWPVDLVYLPFAQAFLAWKILEEDNALSWKHPLPTRKVASLLLLMSIVISNIVFFNLIGYRIAYGSVGYIFWADLLLLVISYINLLPRVLRKCEGKDGSTLRMQNSLLPKRVNTPHL